MARKPNDSLDRSHHGTALIRLGCKCGAVTFAIANEKWPPCSTCGSDRWSRALEPPSPAKPTPKSASDSSPRPKARRLARVSLTEDTKVTPNAAVALGASNVGTTLAEDDDTKTTAPIPSSQRSKRRR